MKLTRFHSTGDGGSRFQEVAIPIDQPYIDEFGNTYHLSQPFASPSVRLVILPAGLDQGWHPAPAHQLVIVLAGTIEVTTTDKESRRWRTGDAFIAADVTGKGHLTKVVEGPAQLAFIGLPDSFSPV